MRTLVRQYARQWVATLKRSEPKAWDTVSDRFLRRVRSRGHTHLLADIAKAVQAMTSPNPIVPVHIVTARPLDSKHQQALVAQVLGDHPTEIRATVDETLVGGVIVRTPNDQWDFSVKAQLERLSRSLADA